MSKTWTSMLSTAGTIIVSLLSCALCPACLPLYVGLLSLVGIELTELSFNFFPLMLTFLIFTLVSMGMQVYRHKADIKPLALAILASALIIVCVLQGYEYILYMSLAGFVAGVFWNKSVIQKVSCSGGCKVHA